MFQFDKTRCSEMLEAAETYPKRREIAAAAFSICALQGTIAQVLGKRILSPECSDLRKAFAITSACSMIAMCDSPADTEYFQACIEAFSKDISDLKQNV